MHLRLFVTIFLAFAFLTETHSLYGEDKWSPDFIVVGAMKAGTGAFRSLMIQHPLIVASTRKEVHFFDLHFEKGEKWYEDQFPKRPTSDHLLGEKSPYYIVHPLVPKRVYSLYPNVKIIMILRNPVSRAYSHYQFNIRNKTEHLSFEKAIDAEPKRLAGEERKLKKNPIYKSKNFKIFSYLTRGMYADQVNRWLKYFPEEQILILTCEDLSAKPLETMNIAFAFLGLPLLDSLNESEKEASNYAPMDPEMRKKLVDFFRPYNQELTELLNRDFAWDK